MYDFGIKDEYYKSDVINDSEETNKRKMLK